MQDEPKNPEDISGSIEGRLGKIAEPVAPAEVQTFEAGAEALEVADKTDDALKPGPVVIAGVEIPDPKAALKNMEEAFGRLPACVRPDKKDMYFKSLPGNKVGESTEEGIGIDPIMLLHPANRFAHVIAHEATHKGLAVPNEGLVEAYLIGIGVTGSEKDGTKTTEKYDRALADFSEFLNRISGGGDPKAMAIEIYNLYYQDKDGNGGDYHKILEIYRTRYVNGLDPAKQDQAIKFFWDIFPELEYDDKGQTQAQSVYEVGERQLARGR
ncbi:MAG: hypothetical protein WC651_03970 [Candidatus Gracilibacteria bacterium]|jgi:hypothetical protein